MSFITGWAFQPSNPWRKQFDTVIRMMIEAGLVDHYKRKTFLRMKREYLESDKEKISFIEPPLVAPMIMDDLQGIFYLLGLGLALSLITFLCEFLFGSMKKTPKIGPQPTTF